MRRKCAASLARSRSVLVTFLFAIALCNAPADAQRSVPAGPGTGLDERANPAQARDTETGRTLAAPTTAPPPPSGAFDRIQYVGPDTYILLDKQGRAQPVPGMTYEDFMAAWKQLQQVEEPDRSARFTLESIEIVGRAEEQHARLQMDVTVLLHTEEPVNVPLGLAEAILDGVPKFDAIEVRAAANPAVAGNSALPVPHRDGEREEIHNASERTTTTEHEYLDYDPQRGGFVARFVGRVNERRTLSLELLVPLLRDGTGTTLSLAYPRTVSSKLSLDVPGRVVEANVTRGTLISQNSSGDGTRLVIGGAMGSFRLSWQTPERGAAEFSSVLNADGAIRVAIDGRSVRTDARLTVRSHGGSFERFRVRLPVGARLVEEQPIDADNADPAYRLLIEQSTAAVNQSSSADGQIVIVELRDKQRGPVTVNLPTEQPIGQADSTSIVQLSGFEVLDAVRQYGDIALEVAPDWQARWELGPFVRQVEPDELDQTLQTTNVTAAFQYDRQPWSMAVRIAARKLRVVATPSYAMECTAEEARLAVQLSYQMLGARAFEFGVELNGWELTNDPIESGGLVDADRVQLTDDGILRLPLAQASSRRAQIEFHLKRSMMGTARHVRLPLPIPVADSIVPAELTVRAGAGHQLVPDIAGSIGIAAQPLTEPADSVAAAEEPEYRFRVGAPHAIFAAELVVRPREVSHATRALISVDGESVRVEQQFAYNVRHQPIRELEFELPAGLDPKRSGLEIFTMAGSEGNSGDVPTGTPVELISDFDATSGEDSLPPARLRATLRQSRLGEFLLRINYQLPRQAGPSGDRWQVPLIRAIDGTSTSQRATVRASGRFDVVLDTAEEGSSWKLNEALEASNSAAEETAKSYVAARPESLLPLVLHALSAESLSTTHVDRIWLQSWMSAEERQDRAAFRFRSDGSQVAVELAPHTPDELEVLMDGAPARVLSRSAGRVIVGVPSAAQEDGRMATDESTPHTLELRYRVPIRFALVTRHALTPPQMIGMTALSQACWHVVLPADKHVIRSPVQMAAASQWQWMGSFWGRGPARSQADLEEWVEAATQLGPSAAHNQYLYTGLAPVSTIALLTAPRWLIVLIASTGALALALAGIYLPGLRRRWVLALVACVVAATAVVFPVPALLLAQASLLGVLFAVLAIGSARLLVRPSPWRVVVPASGSLRHAGGRSDSAVVTPVLAGGSTAPTVSLRVPASE